MRFPLILATALLAWLPAYAADPPEQQEQTFFARLRLATRTPHVATVYRYSDHTCASGEKMFALRAGMLFGSKEARLGMPLWDFHKNGARELEIPVGKFVGKFEGVTDGGSVGTKCNSAFYINAEPGRDYEVIFDFPGAGCSVQVSQIVRTQAGLTERIPLEQDEQLSSECSKRKFRL